MRAFDININGKRTCLAGIGAKGVLTAIVSWTPNDPPTDRLEVGAFDSVTRRHVTWGTFALNVGDDITIRVLDVEPETVDRPDEAT